VGNQAERWDGALTSLEEVTTPLTVEFGDNVRLVIQPCISHAVVYGLIMGIDWLYKYNPHINWRRNRCFSYNTSTRGQCIIQATDFTTNRPDYVVSAKQIARIAEKKLPTSILLMRETDNALPEDSDCYPNNKPVTDPVEDGKTRLQGIMKSLLQGYKDIFAKVLEQIS
jgi:hypothetical protein